MRKTRVLQIVGAMNRGGVESWLMEVLRNIDRDRFQIDFLVHSEVPGAFDSEIRELGSNIFRCPLNRNPATYLKSLFRVLSSNGPFDVVHSHVLYFSGITLSLARACGVPIRISHGHSAPMIENSVLRKAYIRFMSALVYHNATLKLAGSNESAGVLYGPNWKSQKNTRVFYTAIDFRRFVEPRQIRLSRGDFDIPANALVVGHVGRFSTPKNHSFLLDIFSELKHLNANAYLLLVGDGDLRSDIEQKAAKLGIANSVRMTGVREDAPEILMDIVDVLCFPSLYEGLPIAVLEAQAASVPCIISDRITKEVVFRQNLVEFVSLGLGPDSWAQEIMNSCLFPTCLEGHAGAFSMEGSISELSGFYISKSCKFGVSNA